MRRLFGVAAALAMVAAAGWSGGQGEKPGSNVPTITVYHSRWGREFNKEVDKEFEKRMGMHFDMQYNDTEYETKFSIALASKDLPDLMVVNGGMAEQAMKAPELFADFMQYYPQMSNLQKLEAKYPGSFTRIRWKTESGKIIMFPNYSTEGNIYEGFTLQDSLYKANNVKFPTTIAEMIDGLKTLRGVMTTYPYGGCQWFWPALGFRLYNVDRAFYFSTADDKFVYGPVDKSDRYLKALDLMRLMVQEKLTDPESGNATVMSWRNHVQVGNQGKYALALEYKEMIAQYTTEGQKIDPSIHWTIVLPPKNEMGEFPRLNTTMPYTDGWGVLVSANSKYVKEIMKMLDARMSDDITALINWGWEGVTYSVVSGKKQYLPNVKTVMNPTGGINLLELGVDGRTGFFATWDTASSNARNWTKETFDGNELYLNNMKDLVNWPDPPISISDDVTNKRATFKTEADTLLSEAEAKYIGGQSSRDDMLAAINQIKTAGKYGEILAAMNAAYATIKGTWKPATTIR